MESWKLFFLGSNSSIRMKWIGPMVYGLKDSLDITELIRSGMQILSVR